MNSLLNKVSRCKVTATKGSGYDSSNRNEKEIADIRATIDRLIKAQSNYKDRNNEID